MNPQQVTLDEAQIVPELFPALRVAIDANRNSSGRFIITGSSSPELSRKISETLAGRIAIFELSTFSIAEAYNHSVSDLFLVPLTDCESLVQNQNPSRITFHQILTYWERGGYPEPWIKNSEHFHELWMINYFDNYLNRDLVSLFPKLNRDKYRLFLQSLSQLSGTIINYSDLAKLGYIRTNCPGVFRNCSWYICMAFTTCIRKKCDKAHRQASQRTFSGFWTASLFVAYWRTKRSTLSPPHG